MRGIGATRWVASKIQKSIIDFRDLAFEKYLLLRKSQLQKLATCRNQHSLRGRDSLFVGAQKYRCHSRPTSKCFIFYPAFKCPKRDSLGTVLRNIHIGVKLVP